MKKLLTVFFAMGALMLFSCEDPHQEDIDNLIQASSHTPGADGDDEAHTPGADGDDEAHTPGADGDDEAHTPGADGDDEA